MRKYSRHNRTSSLPLHTVNVRFIHLHLPATPTTQHTPHSPRHILEKYKHLFLTTTDPQHIQHIRIARLPEHPPVLCHTRGVVPQAVSYQIIQ
jgi:hypothetical protein